MKTKYRIGENVQVLAIDPDGHVRTPAFIRGKTGIVESYAGLFSNPEELAYGKDGGPKLPLYRVRFQQIKVWSDYAGPAQDTMVLDLYEHWLEIA
ncbi:MAG: nitrile hydratase [Rhodospirillaceae bacterium]|nr:nitrile hydratase [Rhodospirillaceae bacterium]|tara:strand:- start:436 stop:720 length:285 start_codon:yes stop_codon:yes gene_type:complete